MARVLIAAGGRRGELLARELIARAHVVVQTGPEVRSIVGALDGVTIVCLLQGGQLETLLIKLIDTTVRGVLYEGPEAGAVRAACERSHIPHAILAGSTDDDAAWLSSATVEVENLLK